MSHQVPCCPNTCLHTAFGLRTAGLGGVVGRVVQFMSVRAEEHPYFGFFHNEIISFSFRHRGGGRKQRGPCSHDDLLLPNLHHLPQLAPSNIIIKLK